MYIPKAYREDNPEVTDRIIREHSFALLICTDANATPIATHLPLMAHRKEDGTLVLSGHMAKANPQWKQFENKRVLVVFTGAHAYISPSWYNHPNVPTWNYCAVHVYGKVQVLEDEDARNKAMQQMMNYYESKIDGGLEYANLPESLLQQDLRGVVAFTIEAERIETVVKLSQNRDTESFQNIIAQLENQESESAHKIAFLMKQKLPPHDHT